VNRQRTMDSAAMHARPGAPQPAPDTKHSSLNTHHLVLVLVFLALTLLSGSAGVALAYGDHTTHAKLSENTINLVSGNPSYGEIVSFRSVITNGAVAEDARKMPRPGSSTTSSIPLRAGASRPTATCGS
jgi:hypothetical protein